MFGCKGDRYFSNVPVCFMSCFCVQVSLEFDGQVSRGSEAQISASRVLESRAKNRYVTMNQEGSHDLVFEAQVSPSRVLESRAKNRHVTMNQEGSQDLGRLQNHFENSSEFQLVSRATKVIKIGRKAHVQIVCPAPRVLQDGLLPFLCFARGACLVVKKRSDSSTLPLCEDEDETRDACNLLLTSGLSL